MENTEVLNLLKTIRDQWLLSVAGELPVPGPILDADDIQALTDSTGWTGRHLCEVIRLAFAPYDDESLDRLFVPTRPIRFQRRAPHRAELLAILAGRVPALATRVLFHGLAGGMKVVLKPSAAETVFSALLVNSIKLLEPDAPVSVAPARGDALDALVKSVTACVVYGSDETVARIKDSRRGRPTFCGGHMESFEVIFADALDTREDAAGLAEKIARDVAIYDQSGCLSPVAVLVQEGGSVGARGFAGQLVEALCANPYELGRCDPSELAGVRMFLQEASIGGRGNAVITPDSGIPPACVVCGRVRPVPGWRTIQVVSFDSPVPDLSFHMPHLAGRIQGMACAGSQGEVGWLLRKNPEFRANYICEPGQLQNPPALWRENGIVLSHELLAIS